MRKADNTLQQGNDLEVGTNCLGPYLLTLLLEPLLASTSTQPNTPAGSVRIVWVVSILQGQLQKGGMLFESDGTPKILTKFMANYMQSKVGIAWIAGFFADRLGEKGVLSVCVHPGLMPTGLQRHQPWFFRSVIRHSLVSYVSLCAHSPRIRVGVANISYRNSFTNLPLMAHTLFFMPPSLLKSRWKIMAAIAWLGVGNVICLTRSFWQRRAWQTAEAALRRSSWIIVTSS